MNRCFQPKVCVMCEERYTPLSASQKVCAPDGVCGLAWRAQRARQRRHALHPPAPRPPAGFGDCLECGGRFPIEEMRKDRNWCLVCTAARSLQWTRENYDRKLVDCVECGATDRPNGDSSNPRCGNCLALDETTQTRWCFSCHERKPFDDFRAGRKLSPSRNSRCRECESFIGMLQRYHLTRERYFEIFEAQGNCCAICRGTDPGNKHRRVRGWHIDHDHRCCPGRSSCGECIRGILCNSCNGSILAGARDDPLILLSAANYLMAWQSGRADLSVAGQPDHSPTLDQAT